MGYSFLENMNKEGERRFFAKEYEAKDFTVRAGCISLGNWMLKSVRIKAIAPWILKKINHKFTIAKEFGKVNEFHFVPYTDLSYLLESADKCKIETARKIVEDICAEYSQKLISNPTLFQKRLEDCMHDSFHLDKVDRLLKGMKRLNLIDNDLDSILRRNSNTCCIDITLSDVKVFDGYIQVSTENISLSNSIDWGKLYSSRGYDYGVCEGYLYDKRKEIESIFSKKLQESIRDIEREESIKINTYLTKKGFIELLSSRFSYLQKINGHDWEMLTKDMRLSVPIDYLSNKENDGVSLLAGFSTYNIELLLVSDIYDIPQTLKNEYCKLINSFQDDTWMRSAFELKSGYQKYPIREVPLSYIGRENIRYLYFDRGFIQDIMDRDLKTYKILRFYEDYSHYSDIGYWQNGYSSKSPETSPSFVVIDYGTDRIWLCPTDRRYSVYQFAFHSTCCSLETAALAVIKYYSSGINNKRESKETPDMLRHFGLMRFKNKYRW